MKDKIKECKTALSVIPSGLAWRLQPLDISISKVFKESLKKQVCKLLNWQNNIKALKCAIVEWIYELWYSDSAWQWNDI